MTEQKTVLAEEGAWRITKDSHMVALEGPRGKYTDSVECMDHWTRQQFPNIEGNLLMLGLGLGVSAKVVMEEAKNISSMTVLEQSPDVISMYRRSPFRVVDPRMTIVRGDFWKHQFLEKFDSIYIDIFGESNLDGTSIMDDRNTAWQMENGGIGRIIERARTYTDGPVVLWPHGLVAAKGWGV